MRHPFQAISHDRIPRYFIPLILLTLAFMAAFNGLDKPLKTSAAPNGIISFELAGDVSTSQSILDSWDTHARGLAAFGLGLDYLFMVVYSTTIAMGCVWTMSIPIGQKPILHRIGRLLAWGQWLAVLFDGVENAALLKILFADAASPWPDVASTCAMMKFAIIVLGLAYIALGLIVLIGKRIRKPSTAPRS
jgi:hypothetical protein